MTQIGLIGVGLMGRLHAKNAAGHARVVAFADADRERAVRAAREVGAEAREWTDIVADSEIDAVIIASPPHAHEQQVIAAARSGKDVLVEKPIALTLDGAERVVATCREAGVRLQVGFQRRYDLASEEAYRVVRSGQVGRPLLVHTVLREQSRGASAPTDMLTESTIHQLDLVRWLVGEEPCAVSASVRTLGDPASAERADLALVHVRFGGGALALVETFHGASTTYDVREEIVCERGEIAIGGLGERGATTVRTDPPAAGEPGPTFMSRFADAYRSEVIDFVEGIRDRRAPRADGNDGIRALAIALAAVRSATELTEVSL